ncbi:RNA polymerase sigma factor [Streptomyces ochraceiscleroticus]|uniref:RNA polymerase sigma factor n=1 Tax=Streptomyces ochraceiscleroticus TaxID=47761 RepID=A0ABW1MHC3_9ACTN|nr:sigma-70 family RNA polymerase sigma factor [Streptomyces ochraceiscleroticus]
MQPSPLSPPSPPCPPGGTLTGPPPPGGPGPGCAPPDRAAPLTLDLRDADRQAAIAHLFDTHYTQLLRLAVLLGADGDAEDVVSEAFYQLHRRWPKLKTPDAAAGYLRSIVCNLTRMRIRHLRVARRHAYREVDEHVLSAEHQVLLQDDHRALLAALQTLSARQRQALVLKYWLDLKESEISETMGISTGAVKSHTARAMTKLKYALRKVAR